MRRAAKGALGAGAVVLVAAGAALVWARSLFREPEAAAAASLTATLGVRPSSGWAALFAHPDDEIKVAGLLADAGARGVPVRLLAAARGDGGINEGRSAAQLAEVRAAELRRHAAALGVAEVAQWGYDDSHLADLPEALLVDRLAAQLRAWRPDAVLTFAPDSGYTAHPDHLLMGAAATAAFCAVATEAEGPRWLVYALAPRGVARRFGGARGRRVAERQPAPQYAVHVDPAIKARGWAIHASQRDYVRRFAHVPPWLLYRLFDEEHYAVRTRADVCR
jgi:LmbE family N-acetylglucosaminyl deacetylase